MSEVTQQTMAQFVFFPLLIISIVAFLWAVGSLWRKGKTIEALLIWVSMWLYAIVLILLFR